MSTVGCILFRCSSRLKLTKEVQDVFKELLARVTVGILIHGTMKDIMATSWDAKGTQEGELTYLHSLNLRGLWL